MPGRTYLANYHNKRLNEVVIAGAHDAGIYAGGGSNVQTQALNIADQANAGCRFFDLRIATYKSKVNGRTTYTHKAYHLDGKLVRNHKLKGHGGIESYQNVSHAGGWGGGLEEMLKNARSFVRKNPTEFLILKFSKCFNWSDIAELCIRTLGSSHFTGVGNMNNMTVGDFAGKVITVFDEPAREKLSGVLQSLAGHEHGIKFIKPLYDSSGVSLTYDPTYDGMQYFGKFSSTSDIDKNTKKQGQTLSTGAATHIDVLGMMYWTTTGLFGSIRERNAKMWTETNVAALQKTWATGLEAAIQSRFGREQNEAIRLATVGGGGALGGRLKAFMPNIVMMDFVDTDKCDTIDALNRVAATALLSLIIPAPKGPQPVPEI